MQRATPKIAYIIVALGALFYCYEYFLRIAPSIMRNELMTDFNLNATLFGTLSAFYFYAYTPMQLFVGVIVDRFNIRNVMSMAILACTLGSALLASSHTFYIAGLGRFLQGFGSAFAFVGTLKVAAIWLPAERFGLFSGLCATLGFVGAAIGQITLNMIVSHYGWRHTINTFVFLGIALTIAMWLTTNKTAPSVKTSQYKKITLKDNWHNLCVIFKIPRIWLSGLISFLMFMPTSVFAALWGVTYLEKIHGYNSTQASIATAMIFLGWAIGSPLMGWISDSIQNRIICIRIGSLLACALSTLLLYNAALPYYLTCGLFMVFGMLSASQMLTFVTAKDLSPTPAAGTAVAFINMLAMMGGFIFQRGIGQLLDWNASQAITDGTHSYSAQNYMHAMAIIPIGLGIAFLVSLLMKDSLKNNK